MTTSSSDEPPPLQFYKMQGCGNDFILIYPTYPLPEYSLSKLCNRNIGIGADQLLLLEKSEIADIKMRVLEADGSESDMCGNGIRCVAKFMMEKLGLDRAVSVETRAGVKIIEKVDGLFRVNMGESSNPARITITFEGYDYETFFVKVGEPHLVVVVNDACTFDLENFAKKAKQYAEFREQTINVNAVQILDETAIRIRTFERGIEKETLSCGTGATASAIILMGLGKVRNPIRVVSRGGELAVYFKKQAFLLGPAEFVFEGYIKIPEEKNRISAVKL